MRRLLGPQRLCSACALPWKTTPRIPRGSLASPSPSLILTNTFTTHRAAPPETQTKKPLLQHHHLIGDDGGNGSGITSYASAEVLQELHRTRFLDWKALPDHERAFVDVPGPQLISFESAPTFTLGRRQGDLTGEQTARLCRQIQVKLLRRRQPIDRAFTPKVVKTNRGGLTTYHGPGQLVLWPVLDMHSPLYASYGVASYAGHLEAATRRLLSEMFAIDTYVSRDEPGVWVRGTAGGPPRKIAALGVHHRRYVTALGIAVNIDVPVVGSEAVNPWARFVPCGLEGKLVTSVEAELAARQRQGAVDIKCSMRELAERWATVFEQGFSDVSARVFGGEDRGPASRAPV